MSDEPYGSLSEALELLRVYCEQIYHDELQGGRLPLKFWAIEDDDLYWGVLIYLPLYVGEEHLADAPIGFKLAHPIFELEDAFECDGWTAIPNGGEPLLERVIEAYNGIGMADEGKALDALREAFVATPDDEDAWVGAYRKVKKRHQTDEQKEEAIYSFFCRNRHLFEDS